MACEVSTSFQVISHLKIHDKVDVVYDTLTASVMIPDSQNRRSEGRDSQSYLRLF